MWREALKADSWPLMGTSTHLVFREEGVEVRHQRPLPRQDPIIDTWPFDSMGEKVRPILQWKWAGNSWIRTHALG